MWVNQYNGFDTAMPFGGYKQSGWGRELGASAHRSLHPDQGRQHRALTTASSFSRSDTIKENTMKTKAAVLLEAGKPFEIMELDLDGPGPG